MLYTTRVSRQNLNQYATQPDSFSWKKSDKTRETPENYYEPAIELLDKILKRPR